MLHTKNEMSRLSGFREEDFLRFSYESPGMWPFLARGVIILTNLVEDHLVMLHTKNQNSRLSSLGAEDV